MKISRIGTLSILLAVAILFILLQSFVFSRNSIVYVDSNKLLTGYRGMIDARKEFQKKNSVWQANIDSLTNDVKNAISKYSKDEALGTAKEKALSMDLIKAKQKELYDYQTGIKKNANQEEERLNQDVFSTVNAFLIRYGKRNGYKMILIASNGNIAYADPSMEITEKIVDELNKEYSIPVLNSPGK